MIFNVILSLGWRELSGIVSTRVPASYNPVLLEHKSTDSYLRGINL